MYVKREVDDGEDVLDFTLALDERSIGIHLQNLLGERTVGTSFSRSGHNHGEVEKLSNLGMGEDVLTVESGVPVTSRLVEADLEIKDQEKGVVLVKTFPWYSCEVLLLKIVDAGAGYITITADGVEEGDAREEKAGCELHLEDLSDARSLCEMLENAAGVA